MGNSVARRGARQQLIGVWLASLMMATPLAALGCSLDAVNIKGEWGTARFNVEIADDPKEQAQGLMHRTEMPMASGMYFVNERPRRTSFWMRNTLIPLDMLFIDAQGVVKYVHHNAIPLDETPIAGGRDILTVLEINGGLAKKLGITEGSIVRHPAHSDWDPLWPC